MGPNPQAADPPSARPILTLALWFGIVTGLVEGIGLYVLQETELMHWRMSQVAVSARIFWISVVFDVLLYTVLAFVLLGFLRVFSRLPGARLAFAFFVLVTAFDWLALSGRLRLSAMGILALGLGVAAYRIFPAREAALVSFARRSVPWLCVLAALLLLGTEGGIRWRERRELAKLPPAPAGSPNVLVIVVDALRADHLSTYGYSRATSPHLDELARSGVLFENAYSASSWTPPSHASLLTGRHVFEHGAEEHPLDSRLPTIAEALARNGYRTGAFSANTFYFCRRGGFGRGFAVFDDDFYSVGESAWRTLYGRLFELHVLRRLGREQAPARRPAADVNRSLLSWLARTPEAPFFAFLNYYDVHDPYLPSPGFAGKFTGKQHAEAVLNWVLQRRAPKLTASQLQDEIGAYDESIVYVDAQIAELRRELDRRGLLKNTILIITADHGEQFGEHGAYLHRNSLYREEIHVPLIFSWPDHLPGRGLRIAPAVSNVHLAPTILDLIRAGDKAGFPGPSLAQLWRSGNAPAQWPMPLSEMGEFFAAAPPSPARDGSLKSLVSGDWHYVVREDGNTDLFNLRQDPKELSDLAETDEGKLLCQRFAAALQSALAGSPRGLEHVVTSHEQTGASAGPDHPQ